MKSELKRQTALKCPLRQNTIRELFVLPYSDTEFYELNRVLQIVDIKSLELEGIPILTSTNTSIYSATLRDLKEKSGSFVLIIKHKEKLPKVGDMIEINQTLVKKLKSNKKVFLIKSFNILQEYCNINFNLAEPFLYNDTSTDISNIQKNDAIYTPLSQLTSFTKNIVTCGRVIYKTAMKEYKNKYYGAGKLFSFSIRDKEGTEMEVTCFNNEADKFFNTVEKYNVYEIHGGFIKLNNKKFTKSNYKIILENSSKIIKINDTEEIEKKQYTSCQIVLINDISKYNKYSIINVCGIILKIGEKEIIHTKNGDQYKKYCIISDITGYVTVSLWRNHANMDFTKGDIIYIRNIRLLSYNGINLSTIESTIIQKNEQINDFNYIKQYIPNNKLNTLDSTTNTNRNYIKICYIRDILNDTFLKDNILENNFFELGIPIKATIRNLLHINRSFYSGCYNPKCKRKLKEIEDTEGEISYVCLRCGAVYSKPTYYYSLTPIVKDCSSTLELNIFDKVAESLMNISVEEYKNLIDNNDIKKLNEIKNNIEFKEYIFWIKSMYYDFNNNYIKRYYTVRIIPLDNKFYYSYINSLKSFINKSNLNI